MRVVGYGEAICEAFRYLLQSDPKFFVIGQGLWAPWYVGNSMQNLDRDFGTERIIDSPVSENGCTGAALGAGLCGYRSVVVHPRVDFMILAVDQIVNQAAKWSSMFGGQASPCVTIRGIVNRGGEQGAQHSQALHSWFAHIPGLRVVMPATAADARDLLISSVRYNGPVLYIDDRWLYGEKSELSPIIERPLEKEGPRRIREGSDITLVGASFSTKLCLDAARELENSGIAADVIDLRVINPLDTSLIVESVMRTGRLCVVDGSWRSCGLAGEIISSVAEALPVAAWKAAPARVTLPAAPAPTSRALEEMYYPTSATVVEAAIALVQRPLKGQVSKLVAASAEAAVPEPRTIVANVTATRGSSTSQKASS